MEPIMDKLGHPLKGIAYKVISAFVFTIMIALVKLVSDRIPAGEIVFSRAFFGFIPLLIMITWRGELAVALQTHDRLSHVARALTGMIGMFLWFTALSLIPLPDATAISYAAPLLTVALAALLLHERVRAYRWAAVGVGFIGVLIMLSPHLGSGGAIGVDGNGALLALAATVFFALAQIFIRKLVETERTVTIVVYFSITVSFFSLLTLPLGWVIPSPGDAFYLVLIGIIGGFGQILLTQAYRHANASLVAPFDYTTMLWAILIGIFLFDEVPQTAVLAGAAIVIASGLFVIYREHRLGIDRSRARRASTPSKA